MSRHRLRIWWMDDEPDRLTTFARNTIAQPDQLAGRSAELRVVKLGGDKGLVAILDDLDSEKRKNRGPDLIVIDQMLQLTAADAYLQRGSSLAAAIRDKFPNIPLVGVTGANFGDVDELQKTQFIEFFLRDQIADGTHIPDLYAIADGYASLVKFFGSSGASNSLALDLCKLVKCPVSDTDLFISSLPGDFKSTWDAGTTHTFARWIWHNLQGRPGLLYDDLETATLLGLKREGLALLHQRLITCAYKGIFVSATRPRWWVSLVRKRIRQVAKGSMADPLSKLGRKLAVQPQHFSKCHGRPNSSDVPTVVAFSDGTQRKRIQARIEDTVPLETDSPPFGFEQRRVFAS